MGEDKINLFLTAMSSNELEQFLIGEGKYFLLNREVGVHWPLGNYIFHIEDYLKKHNSIFEYSFWDKLIETIDKSEDKNILIDFVVAFLTPYYHSQDSEISISRNKNTPFHFIEKIHHFILTNKESLLNDKRGSGVEWNSDSGLLGGMINNLKIIKKRGGPNFVPGEFI